MRAEPLAVADAPSLRRKLMRHVQISEDCWTWRSPLDGSKQPRLRVDGRERQATHVAWRIVYGEWPRVQRFRTMVAQQCGNRFCVRPRHLAILNLHEILRLRSARLELAEERLCQVCEKPMHVKRWLITRGWGRWCSQRCYRAA